MTTIILIVILVVIICGFAFIIYVLNQRIGDLRKDSGAGMLKQDITNLTRGVTELKDGLQQNLNERLDRNQLLMQRQFSESTKIITEVTHRLTKLDETNRRVSDVADDLKLLQNVLQNPKHRGGFGEYYLDAALGNVLPPNAYQLQYPFKDGEIVDAVIKLDKNRLLPIDSKFTLENYNRLVEEPDKVRRDNLANLFKRDLKNRIDETAKYIRPDENTLDYAFMFLPSEAIYYDLLVNKIGATGTSARDLIEYAFIDKHVIIVSPTTLMAYLQTVLQGLRSLQIEEQTKDIQKRVIMLSKHFAGHEQYMQKLGSSLATTVNHFNTAHKELGKIDKDVIKIAQTAPTVNPVLIDRPDTLEN